MTSAATDSSVASASQPLRSAQAAVTSGMVGPRSASASASSASGISPNVPSPSGEGRSATDEPNPPSKSMKVSSVPWNVITGTGRPKAHPSMSRMPATGAAAAMRSL